MFDNVRSDNQEENNIVLCTCQVSSAFTNGGAVPAEYAVGTVAGDDSLSSVAAGLAEGADNRSAMPSAPVAATFFDSYYYYVTATA
ncbi:MAG: hypothetical protein K5930_09860 [Treponemataceae bacterium]|nr:hypothetical protein [Treponemataceae bacterium]